MSNKVNVLYISPDFSYSCGVSKHVFEVLKYIKRHHDFNVYYITNGGDALLKLKTENINYKLISFSKGWKNIFHFLFNYYHLKSFCINNNIDIIHTHHRYPELLSTLIAKRLNIKTITTVHSLVKGYKHLSFKSDKIITVSNAVKKSIINNFIVPAKKVETFYNCIYPWKYQETNRVQNLKEKLNIVPNDFVLLFLGRLNKIKGIDLLILAFRTIKSVYPNIKLLLVGEILDNTYKKLNVKLNEDILYLSARIDINVFIEFSDIIILPSREDPFPYVMLEAGIASKPFIGSRTGGIAEFIEDGVNGFLFEPGNAEDLEDKIRFVINNPEKAKSAAEELHKKVIKYCNCEEYFAKLTNIYNELSNK